MVHYKTLSQTAMLHYTLRQTPMVHYTNTRQTPTVHYTNTQTDFHGTLHKYSDRLPWPLTQTLRQTPETLRTQTPMVHYKTLSQTAKLHYTLRDTPMVHYTNTRQTSTVHYTNTQKDPNGTLHKYSSRLPRYMTQTLGQTYTVHYTNT